MEKQLSSIYRYEDKVGADGKHILIGEQAFNRCGLTSFVSSTLQCSTLYIGITGIWNPFVMWYFNPFADKYEHTKPSVCNPNILVPTTERAIVEYIIFHDYFDEGILIEGLKTYLSLNNNDISAIHEEADYWHLPSNYVDYWFKEAREDFED